MNTVTLMGRLVRDCTIRYTTNEKIVANFTLAIRRPFQTNGRTADFINCIAWGQQAEFINHYFGKGSMIAIKGRLQSNTWGQQNGKTNYSIEVVVEDVYFTGEKKVMKNHSQPMQATDIESIEDIDFDTNTISALETENGEAI